MKKFEYLILVLSLLGTAIISAVFGFAGSSIVGTFWGWFWISFATQIIGFLIWNSYLLQQQSNFNQQTELALLEQISKFAVRLSCAYCKQQNDVPIQLNEKNTFKCDSCNQTNGIYMQFTATTLTTPLESVKLPLPETNQELEIKVRS
jgi:hypothetical protein